MQGNLFDLVYLRFAKNAQRVNLSAELTAEPLMLELFGEVGANFSLLLSSRTQLVKIKSKNAIAENQCENINKYPNGQQWLTMEPA